MIINKNKRKTKEELKLIDFEIIKQVDLGISFAKIAKSLNMKHRTVVSRARKIGIKSKVAKYTQINRELSNKGKRKCISCENIYLRHNFYKGCNRCIKCAKENDKLRYKEFKNNSSIERIIHLRVGSAKGRALKNNMEFNLTDTNIYELYLKQNGLCYYSKIEMRPTIGKYRKQESYSLSIDRTDSNKGYTLDNIVLCCDCINTMKMAYSKEFFIEMCRKIVLNNG